MDSIEVAAATPRLAATMLIVRDDPFEVLMVTRPTTGTFPSAVVFPGGSVDAADYVAGGGETLDDEERALRVAGVRETREETGIDLAIAGLDLADIHPFAHWITPEFAPRRFDTHFYLAAAPLGQEPRWDGSEIIDVAWHEPSALLARAEADDPAILFPTHANLSRLAQSSSVAEAIAAVAGAAFEPLSPTVVTKADGGRYLTLPASSGYPVTERRLPD